MLGLAVAKDRVDPFMDAVRLAKSLPDPKPMTFNPGDLVVMSHQSMVCSVCSPDPDQHRSATISLLAVGVGLALFGAIFWYVLVTPDTGTLRVMAVSALLWFGYRMIVVPAVRVWRRTRRIPQVDRSQIPGDDLI